MGCSVSRGGAGITEGASAGGGAAPRGTPAARSPPGGCPLPSGCTPKSFPVQRTPPSVPHAPFLPPWPPSVPRSLPPWPPAPHALDLSRAPPAAGRGEEMFPEMSLAAEVGSSAPPSQPPLPPSRTSRSRCRVPAGCALRGSRGGGGGRGGREGGAEFCPKSQPRVSLIRVVMYCHALRDVRVSAGALSPAGRWHRPQRGAAPCHSPREGESRRGCVTPLRADSGRPIKLYIAVGT